MRAVPEELVAGRAFEILVEPESGAGRDSVPNDLRIDLAQFATAVHAAGCPKCQGELATYKIELILDGQSRCDPESAHVLLLDEATIHERTVGREKSVALVLSRLHSLGVVVVGSPLGLVAGRPEPACEAAQTGIAEKGRGFAVRS